MTQTWCVMPRHSGQALAEFLIVALALVPLLLLVPVIGKYQDLSHVTQIASRYAGFDATIRNDVQNNWKPESELANEVRRRFFSNSDAPIKTNDVADNSVAYRNPLWSDLKGNPLINKFSDVSVTFGMAGSSSHADAFSGAGDGAVFNRIPIANANAMGLRAQGVYTANISVVLANLPSGIRSLEPFDNIDLSIKRHTSVVIDGWASPSPAETESRFGNMVPLNTVLGSPIQTLVDFGVSVVELAQVKPPKFGRLETWRDVVPTDRLKPAN